LKKSLQENDLVFGTKNDHRSFLSEDEKDKGLHGFTIWLPNNALQGQDEQHPF
jgi:hypothetical protein